MLGGLTLKSGNICHVNRAWFYLKKCFSKASVSKKALSEARISETRMKVLRLDVDV